jgi:hypothetical protein
MVGHFCNFSKVETGELWVSDQLGLHSETYLTKMFFPLSTCQARLFHPCIHDLSLMHFSSELSCLIPCFNTLLIVAFEQVGNRIEFAHISSLETLTIQSARSLGIHK